jgi:hypothetical protein
VYELILAQTVHNVNAYSAHFYGITSIALMHTVRYYSSAPV